MYYYYKKSDKDNKIKPTWRLFISQDIRGINDEPRKNDDYFSDIVLDFRKNRSYDLPKELGIDFDKYDDGQLNLSYLDKEYERDFIDCYIHGDYCFSLRGEGIQCQFDTARKCGIIAIKKDKLKELGIEKGDVRKYFKDFLYCYNHRFNGEVYRVDLEELVEYTSKDGRKLEQREMYDCNTGYYDIKDILDEYEELVEGNEDSYY